MNIYTSACSSFCRGVIGRSVKCLGECYGWFQWLQRAECFSTGSVALAAAFSGSWGKTSGVTRCVTSVTHLRNCQRAGGSNSSHVWRFILAQKVLLQPFRLTQKLFFKAHKPFGEQMSLFRMKSLQGNFNYLVKVSPDLINSIYPAAWYLLFACPTLCCSETLRLRQQRVKLL